MTATEYVALARKAEDQSIRQRAHYYDEDQPYVLWIDRDGEWLIDPAAEVPARAIMRAPIDTTTRPDGALTRALLASAIAIHGEGPYRASLGLNQPPMTWPPSVMSDAYGVTEAEAREALLDALVAEAEG